MRVRKLVMYAVKGSEHFRVARRTLSQDYAHGRSSRVWVTLFFFPQSRLGSLYITSKHARVTAEIACEPGFVIIHHVPSTA